MIIIDVSASGEFGSAMQSKQEMMAGTGMVLQHGNLNHGVITGEDARLRVSPFNSAAASGVVKSGKVVKLADT